MGRKLEEFKPLNDKEVRMYTCGPTVWNYAHIGNFRSFLFEDLLRRYLKYRGYKVTQVMNITDVDDRIIKTLKETKISLQELTEKYTKAFFDDLDYLRIDHAESYPRATNHIQEMVDIIEGLLGKGYAYRGDDGSIYYNISKFRNYGRLSGLKVSDLKPGVRVRQDDYTKESAEDFALWKAWDESDGDVFWETSVGKGRPGWHIECSAMSMKYLGETFDMHTGGVDNMFPHHENEIAQSEAYTGKQFVKYWMHNEHLLVKDEKMAKRLGNFVTVAELRERGVDGIALRFFLLSAQYRTQLSFRENSLEQAAASVKRISEFVSRLEGVAELGSSTTDSHASNEVRELVERTRASYMGALDNDLDTPRALAGVFEFITLVNKMLDLKEVDSAGARLVLEFMDRDFGSVFAVVETGSDDASVSPEAKKLLREREEARKMKNWALADSIRMQLGKLGIEVQDTQQGQKWRKKSAGLS
jgi:cysteinyl-tRNA synthetase